MKFKDYHLHQTPIDHFSENHEFDINSYHHFEQLKKAIKTIGILCPVMALQNRGALIIIDGFKRYKIARETGLKTIPAILFPEGTSLKEAIRIRYFDLKSSSTDLNILQKIDLYKLLIKYQSSTPELKNWLETLNLPRDPKTLTSLRLISDWPLQARQYIHQYHASFQNIRFLLGVPKDLISLLFEMANLLSIRWIELSEIYHLLNEIALNTGANIREILNHPEVVALFSQEKVNHKQKVMALKELLHNWRYPLLSDYRHKFNLLLKELSLPDNFFVWYDKNFERAGLTIQLKINNQKQFDLALSELTKPLTISKFRELINLL